MPKIIEKIKIENFRGSSKCFEIAFNKLKPIVLIFGENGTGKSTIVDAIEFVCNQNIGSLQDFT